MTTITLNIPLELAVVVGIYLLARVVFWIPTVISWVLRRIPGA